MKCTYDDDHKDRDSLTARAARKGGVCVCVCMYKQKEQARAHTTHCLYRPPKVSLNSRAGP